ncbi:MAG: glycosyltransferase family 4 protein [Leptolyngbyaceae cyanobacterium MAG.088]|nr:glycosyltransferase family 4 protein [Leptolyngbyaceae cyanobacterium MAG.088]
MKNTTEWDQNSSPDILIVTRTFLPNAGGIEEYAYNRCLQDPSRVIVLTSQCAGHEKFDQAQPFPIHRWPVPSFLEYGALGSILKQFVYMFWLGLLCIRLFSLYRYKHIEWCHGYDFPILLFVRYVLPIRYFIYLHGNDLLCALKNPVFKIFFTYTLNISNGIVCNSSFTKDILQKGCNVYSPIYTINPTIRPSKFGLKEHLSCPTSHPNHVRELYNISSQAIVILTVGRLVRRKGFNHIIESLPSLLGEGIDVHYLICGKGKIEPELRNLVSRLRLEDRVHFAGYIPDDKLASYYTACDLFAMLTFFDDQASSIEGFGIVYLEAGYFCKPVLAARVGGVVDAVFHEENGVLINSDSDEEILDALYKLCKDEDLRHQLGKKGQELACRKTLHRILYSP